MDVAAFAEIQAEFEKRISTIVYCNLATVNTQGRPRSRVVHPVWEGTTGWLDTRPASHKLKHLAANPYVSLAYISATTPVYIDCRAELVEDAAEKQRVWDYIKSVPAPYGYDPGLIFKTLDDFGLLKLTPWRIELSHFPKPSQVWRQDMKAVLSKFRQITGASRVHAPVPTSCLMTPVLHRATQPAS